MQEEQRAKAASVVLFRFSCDQETYIRLTRECDFGDNRTDIVFLRCTKEGSHDDDDVSNMM